MEGHMSKRRRIYSQELRKIIQANFARKYVKYLVPALTKISKEILSGESTNHEIEEIVRYEMDMALALSAEGFAWSHALKDKLQLYVNVARFQSSLAYHQLPSFKISSSTYSPDCGNMIQNEVDDHQNAMLLKKISSKPDHEPTAKKSKKAKRTEMQPESMKEEEVESGEENQIRRRLTYLRTLLP
ncbi:hypothetical protein QQP08_026080 [Theobroma cacao]|nr:hypothetical protein QQP08_026080 [Theobroma cacao]